MKRSRWSCVALVFFLVAPVQALAQDSIDSKVRALEEAVQLLERRVATLEAQVHTEDAPSKVSPGKTNWRKLRNGISEAEVEALLGSPLKVNANEGYFVWWYDNLGFVRFDTKSRKVEAWSEP